MVWDDETTNLRWRSTTTKVDGKFVICPYAFNRSFQQDVEVPVMGTEFWTQARQVVYVVGRALTSQRNKTQHSFSFPLQHNHESHQTQRRRFEPRMLRQQYCDVTYERHVTHDAPYDVFFSVEVVLASSVEFRVVCKVVVAFCEEFEWFGSVERREV